MRILIDIGHPSQLNFLKIPIQFLNTSNDLFVTYLNRGILGDIVKKELNNINIKELGKHNYSIFSIIWNANICKFFQFIKFIYKNKIQIGINGGVPMGIAMRIMRRKYIQFNDDYERGMIILLEKILANKLYLFPSTIPLNSRKNIFLVNSLKEWAYLSPKYFSPNIRVLDEYNIKPGQYIFVREVSTRTINYLCQKEGVISVYQNALTSTNLTILLSLENKDDREKYPNEWILLNEPVNDIHSLMYFSKCVISSGDSMAREGAMLGVISIYCGSRDMLANSFLIPISNFKWAKNYDEFITAIQSEHVYEQEVVRNNIYKEWVDVNELVINSIL